MTLSDPTTIRLDRSDRAALGVLGGTRPQKEREVVVCELATAVGWLEVWTADPSRQGAAP